MFLGLLHYPKNKINTNNPEQGISIIIAFRNEERNIITLLESLKNQNYSKENFEIILCNDHSNDASVELIEQYKQNNNNLKILLLHNKNNEHGKKYALKNAVSAATYNILAFIDADCKALANWLKIISKKFNNDNLLKMLCGPVAFYPSKTLLQHLLSLEFASLIAIAAASIKNKKPFICNAANMAVLKNVYLNIVNNQQNYQYASGDDIFLLHAVKKKYGYESIGFMYHHDALVLTQSPLNFKMFINQRIRWSSKTLGYSDKFALFSAWLVLLVCFVLASGLFFSFFYAKLGSFFIGLFLLKTVVDALLLYHILRLFKQTYLLKWIILEQFIYIIYVPFIAFYSLKGSYEWKGRIVR